MDAVLRRGSMKREKMTAYEANGVEVDTASRTVKADGREVVLTKKEFDLLACLIRSPGQVFTRDQLLDAAAAAGEERLDRSIDAHIKNIREKMKAAAPEKQLLRRYGESVTVFRKKRNLLHEAVNQIRTARTGWIYPADFDDESGFLLYI
jgi:DNA-binding response OmpR family regulator